jgi:titin
VTEVYKDYVVLAWDIPETDGNSPITGYSIEKRDMKRSSFIKVEEVKTLTLKVPKLIEGNEYMFQVCAINDIGTSDWTQLDEPVKARLPFGEFMCSLN